MYWHGSLDNTRRTVEKIVADRAKGILVITSIGSTPCPLEDLKSTLDSITLNEMARARGGAVHRRQGCINALSGSSVGYQGFPGGWGASPAHG